MTPTSVQDSLCDPILGVGRAAIVFKSTDETGHVTARKVFTSTALTRLVQSVFLGSPNPYAWCEHAVQAAILRRRILAPLVDTWTGGRMRVAAGLNVDWSREHQAWQLHTEFSPGRPPALHHPLCPDGAGEVEELQRWMRRLAWHLRSAGFDGQVWQAGLGNPVALANFLLEEDSSGKRTWAWIDLESGVPALFPAHLPSLWRFYLPRAIRYGRPLFDDVNVVRLEAWLKAQRPQLVRELGPATVEGIERDVAALGYHQDAWRSMPRLTRSVRSQLAKDRITPAQARSYERAPLRWYTREAWRAARGLTRHAKHELAKLGRALARVPWGKCARGLANFLSSHRYRTTLAERFVDSRLTLWRKRGQLSQTQAERLRNQLGREESSVYLADFGVHLAIKPFVKSTEYLLCPALYAAGVIDAVTLSLVWMSGGSVGRTAYTAGRMIQNLLRGRELPWTALWVGLFPVLGNLAFPLQIVRSGREDEDTIARFLLYDGCSVIGRRIPIWGGPDTLTEHWINHWPDRLVR
jgi:hypothetical protein